MAKVPTLITSIWMIKSKIITTINTIIMKMLGTRVLYKTKALILLATSSPVFLNNSR